MEDFGKNQSNEIEWEREIIQKNNEQNQGAIIELYKKIFKKTT